MKFGVREICDVVLRAKAAQKIGNKVFYKNEPVLYFDTLKTSTLEGAATTVYAQGGRGNARLVAWEGERTVTFTMEDALISPMGFSILTGAGLIETNSNDQHQIIIHQTEQTDNFTCYKGGVSNESVSTQDNDTLTHVKIKIKGEPYVDSTKKTSEDFIYVMLLDDNGEIISEPYIAEEEDSLTPDNEGYYIIKVLSSASNPTRTNNLKDFKKASAVLVDYYVAKTEGAFQINITPDKFGGNFYLEASTLFRATNGVDMPAEFIIPNCKIQSNFNFTMASSGDPSTFTFTMDAFPDYTRWDKSKKVYAAIQVIEQSDKLTDLERLGTPHDNAAGYAGQKTYIEFS